MSQIEQQHFLQSPKWQLIGMS